MRPLLGTLFLAVGFFLFDAFILNQGALSLLLLLASPFFLVPWAIWIRRKDPQGYRRRLAKTGIFLLAFVAVLFAVAMQNRRADRKAIEIGNACLAYRAKYGKYPVTLDELVPEFLPSVPVARYGLAGDLRFFYTPSPFGKDREPMLFYQAMPPFGRRFYHMESGSWGFLD